MKKLIFIIVWIACFSGTEKSSKYILYTDSNGVIISIPRENFIDYMEFMDINHDKIDRNWKIKAKYININ